LKFLAQGFFYPDNEEFIEKGSSALLGLAQDLKISLPQVDKIPTLLEHQSEFVRLFMAAPGGVPAPPYASYYINSQKLLFQEGLEQVMEYYQKAGLEPASKSEPPDHLSLELALASHMIDSGHFALLDDFLHNHLLLWYPKFEKKLFNAGPSWWFKLLGQVTGKLLKQISSMEGGSYEKA